MNLRIYPFFALVRKEILQMLKNPKMKMTIFVAPILQLMLLGYAATMELREVKFAVLDHDHSMESRELIATFAGSPTYIRQENFASEKEMQNRISGKQVTMALVIPQNFARNLAESGSTDVQVIIDCRNSYTAGVALGYASDIVQKFNTNRSGRNNAQVVLGTRGWYNPTMDGQFFMIPALLATLSLTAFTLLVALSFAKEREAGTIDQLLLTPYSPLEILSAKGLASMIVGFGQLCFCLFFVVGVFHIPYRSSYPLLFFLFVAILSAAVGIGLFISVHCKNMQQAMIFTFMFNVPFTALSGIATPLANMPEWLYHLMVINPMRWAVETLHILFLEGGEWAMVWKKYLILFVIGAIAFSLASVSFVRQRRS